VIRYPSEATAGIIVLECKGRLSPQAIKDRSADGVLYLRKHAIQRELWIVEPGRLRIRQQGDSSSAAERGTRAGGGDVGVIALSPRTRSPC